MSSPYTNTLWRHISALGVAANIVCFYMVNFKTMPDIVKHTAEVGSVREGDPIAYLVSVFNNVKN